MIEGARKGHKRFAIVISVILVLTLGVTVGRYLIPAPITISYISQKELLDLEKARIQEQGLENRQLFLGKPEQAIKLIKAQQQERSRLSNIVLLSERAVFGPNVKSIGAEVHKQIIANLKKGK